MLQIAWYICPYKRRLDAPRPTRYCAMDDYTQQIIYTDGGNWSETEVEGDRAIVKVSASKDTLKELNKVFERLPDDFLTNIFKKSEVFKPRRKPRYDKDTDTIICDGEIQPTKSLEEVDRSVK